MRGILLAQLTCKYIFHNNWVKWLSINSNHFIWELNDVIYLYFIIFLLFLSLYNLSFILTIEVPFCRECIDPFEKPECEEAFDIFVNEVLYVGNGKILLHSLYTRIHLMDLLLPYCLHIPTTKRDTPGCYHLHEILFCYSTYFWRS